MEAKQSHIIHAHVTSRLFVAKYVTSSFRVIKSKTIIKLGTHDYHEARSHGIDLGSGRSKVKFVRLESVRVPACAYSSPQFIRIC